MALVFFLYTITPLSGRKFFPCGIEHFQQELGLSFLVG